MIRALPLPLALVALLFSPSVRAQSPTPSDPAPSPPDSAPAPSSSPASDSPSPPPTIPPAPPGYTVRPVDEHGLGAPPMPPPGYVPGHREAVGLGLSPHVPGQPSVLPGGVIPAFGAPLRPTQGARFDFHGYLQAGGRVGFNNRQHRNDGQGSLVWHGDPSVPRGNVFENTNTVPYTWSELRFSYSTPMVTATVSLGAWALSQAMQASGSFQPNAQLWVRDAFLTYVPRGLDPVKLTWNVGVFEDRYGWMEQYSSGAYGAPLVATIAGVGETLTATLPIGPNFQLKLEHGIKSNLDRPPANVPTGPSNNWQKPWEGQTLVNHAHAGLDYKGMIQPSLHFIAASARDDQGDEVALGNLRACYNDYVGGTPEDCTDLDHADGSLRTFAADVRFAMRRFGYLYLGVSHTEVEHVRTLNGVVQILNAGGGRDFMDRWAGRNNDRGRASLLLAGGQYTVSLGELLRYPEEYFGEGPDLRLSVFGMYAHITSDDPARDGEDKYKFGLEATYSMLPWLAAAGRFDRSVPYVHQPKARFFDEPPRDPLCVATGEVNGAGQSAYRCSLYPRQNDNSFSVLTAKLILRSDWTAREALTLQYSHFIYRSDFHLVTLNSGGQVSTQTDQPDQHLLALYGTLWW